MFDSSPRLEDILSAVRGFVRQELIPLELDFITKGYAAMEPALGQKRQQVKALGLWLPQVPRDYGGLGLSLFEHGLVSQELGQTPIGHYVFNCQAPDAGNIEILIQHPTPPPPHPYLLPFPTPPIPTC